VVAVANASDLELFMLGLTKCLRIATLDTPRSQAETRNALLEIYLTQRGDLMKAKSSKLGPGVSINADSVENVKEIGLQRKEHTRKILPTAKSG